MRCLDFGTSFAVDKAQSGKSTGSVINFADVLFEFRFTKGSIEELLDDLAVDLN